MKIYCREIRVNKPLLTKSKGPLLLAANHPNSFLDAVLLDILFDEPILALARGDVFKNKKAAWILKKLNILPVYRLREGAENLNENYKTFDACVAHFHRNGVVLIFSEGLCKNEWRLRPLKKGTARLAMQSWNEHIPLKILPVGLNYSSHRRFAKVVEINFGEAFSKEDLDLRGNEGQNILKINNEISTQLQTLVHAIDVDDHPSIEKLFYKSKGRFTKALLTLPAWIGYGTHVLYYKAVKTILGKRVRNSVHYDSIMMFALMFSYPFVLILAGWIGWLCLHNYWALAVPAALALCAYAYAQTKPNLDHH